MRIQRAFLLGCILVWALTGLAAAKIPKPPQPPRALNDFANLLPPAAAQEIESQLTAIHQQKGVAFVVVTTPELGNYSLEEFAVRLFSEWGIGKAGEDKGLLFLVATKERQMRFEVGYGLEGELPDAFCGQVLDEEVLPAFAKGDYAGGIKAAITRINARLEGEPLQADRPESRFPWEVLIIIVLLFLFTRSHRNRYYPGSRGPFPPIFWGGGGTSRGGFGGSGGFGGFGGGRSGGGGASRGW